MGSRVYIGRLGRDVRDRDVENFFKGYGRLSGINLKEGFGFVVSHRYFVVLWILNQRD